MDGRAADVGAARGRVAQRHDLGVGTACFLRAAAAGDAAVGGDDDAADARVRIAVPTRVLGENERLAHNSGDSSAEGASVMVFASRLLSSRLMRLRACSARFARAAFAAANDEKISPDQGGADVDVAPPDAMFASIAAGVAEA